MKIKNIKIKNFYSFVDVSLDLSKHEGLTLIKGHNKDAKGSNGAGKSALVEAVYFGLTGKTIRKSTEDAILHNQAKKGCYVELELEGGIVIKRTKKPTKLELFINGEARTQAGVVQTQQLIDEVLNTNYKVLMCSMFFGQSNDLNFLDCSADDKRVIIRNFLNLDDIFSMRDRIKKNKSDYYQNMKQQDSLIKEHSSMIKELTTKIDKIKKAKQKFSKYDDSILSLSLEDILNQEEQESSRLWQEAQIGNNYDKTVDKIKELVKQSNVPPKSHPCEWCGDVVETKPDKDGLEKKIKDLQKERDGLDKSLNEVRKQKIDVAISSREFTKVLSFKELCRDETNYESLIATFGKKIEDCSKLKAENKTMYDVMRFWEKAFSEQGIIKYIIRNILEYFNDRCNYYLSYLTGNKYFVEFDEELSEKIETGGRIVQYISLSGGEKRKINLSIVLALKDLLMLTDKDQSDLLFFDEVAENLDEEGVTGLYQLLQEIKKDKTIFVITHNKYLKTLLDSAKRISIIKEKGISRIKTK